MTTSAVAHMDDAAPSDTAEADATYGKVMRRIVPFLCIGFMAAYVDRVNVGFAKLQMLSDLRMSETVFGLGAGPFFLDPRRPANLDRAHHADLGPAVGPDDGRARPVRRLQRAVPVGRGGGRLHAGRPVPSGAVVSGGKRGGRATALFMIGIPLASVVGGPLSGAILTGLSGAFGLAGWRWLFVLEAAPPTFLVGWLKLLTHSTNLVVLIFASVLVASALAVFAIPREPVTGRKR